MVDLLRSSRSSSASSPGTELSHRCAARFQLVLRRFIGVFARPEHPLALFLDDLQWLDAATPTSSRTCSPVGAAYLMLTAPGQRVFGPSLMRKARGDPEAGAPVQELRLGRSPAMTWVSSSRCSSLPAGAPPAGGAGARENWRQPFFVIQFISVLATKG